MSDTSPQSPSPSPSQTPGPGTPLAALVERARSRCQALPPDMLDYRVRDAEQRVLIVSTAMLVEPVAGLHAHLVAAGATSRESAIVVMGGRAWAEPTRDPYAMAVVTQRGDAGYCAVITRDGRPDAGLDKAMRLIDPDYQPDHTPGAPRALAVARWNDAAPTYNTPRLPNVLAALVSDQWLSARLVRAHALAALSSVDDASLTPFGEASATVDQVAPWWEVLEQLAVRFGMRASLAARTATIEAVGLRNLGRKADDPDAVFDDLGDQLALREHGLPHAAPRVLHALLTTTIEERLARQVLAETERSYALCVAHGFRAPNVPFSYNDLDNAAFAFAVDDWRGVAWHDQNAAYALAWPEQATDEREVVVHAVPMDEDWVAALHLTASALGTPHHPSELGRFRVHAGQVTTTRDLALANAQVRLWNGLLFGTGALETALTEDLPRIAVPPDTSPHGRRSR